MVVDAVEDDAEIARMARADKPLERIRPAIRLVHGVERDAVVAPPVLTGVRRHRQHFNGIDPELDEMVESLDGRVERAFGCERADMHLVKNGAGERYASPSVVVPLET